MKMFTHLDIVGRDRWPLWRNTVKHRSQISPFVHSHFYSFFYRFGLKFNTLNAVFSFPNQSHQKRNLCKNNWEIRPRVIFSEFLSIPTEQHKLWTHSSKSRNKTKHFLWPFYLKSCKNKTLKLTLGYTLLLDTPESEKIWLESFLVPSNAS